MTNAGWSYCAKIGNIDDHQAFITALIHQEGQGYKKIRNHL